ncbi:hypothetical protein NQ317_002527 [Molorchus minor]|uniref:Uncharacterized protein n=1 Tax=Molorchus minor TaxID=1323400 RepID=A0ABQ9IV91_9CUCU|nr:hypothetical protein NQ317_002527 [Molorchus minor]
MLEIETDFNQRFTAQIDIVYKNWPTVSNAIVKELRERRINDTNTFKDTSLHALMMLPVKDYGELEQRVILRRERLFSYGMSMQPSVCIVGELAEPTFYIIVDDIRYKIDTSIRALELIFKLYHTFDLDWPIESEHIWLFLEQLVFEMKSGKKCSSTETIIADIKKHLKTHGIVSNLQTTQNISPEKKTPQKPQVSAASECLDEIQIVLPSQNTEIFDEGGKILNFVGHFGLHKSFERFCKSTRYETQYLTTENASSLRNVANFNQDVSENVTFVTGIKYVSILNSIETFHVTNNFCVDIAHDIFEGVGVFIMSNILHQFILVDKLFDFDLLNHQIKYFNFTQNHNKPPLISLDQLRRKCLKMSAIEMKHFIINSGLMFAHLIPEVPLKPKFHFLTHYPTIMKKIGPLSQTMTLRYESKHRQLKLAANLDMHATKKCNALTAIFPGVGQEFASKQLLSKENATNKRKYVTKKHYCVYCETLQAQLPMGLNEKKY